MPPPPSPRPRARRCRSPTPTIPISPSSTAPSSPTAPTPGASTPTANICVFAAREVDRSPTGSGVTARIAVQLARGLIRLGQSRKFESITGAIFTGKALRETPRPARFHAVTVEVSGSAHYTGTASFTYEPGDEIGQGFLLR